MASFEIGTFNLGPDNSNSNSGSGYHGGSSSSHGLGSASQSGQVIQGGPGIRETGIIEKLLVRHEINQI